MSDRNPNSSKPRFRSFSSNTSPINAEPRPLVPQYSLAVLRAVVWSDSTVGRSRIGISVDFEPLWGAALPYHEFVVRDVSDEGGRCRYRRYW